MNDVVPLLKFTPSAQDPQVLEAITVQREQLITKLVDVASDREGARHQLLIGPRGMGKTHILSLVASRVRGVGGADSTVGWLEEDPWGIGSYQKFLTAILARVAKERADEDLLARADELHAVRDDSGGSAEQALRDALGDSRLVLLVENLDDIFRRIGDNGQERFRAFAEDWQQMVIIATAPQLFEGVQFHESPFYGFFAITHLEELSLDSATELMRRVAELRGDETLIRFLETDVARHRLAAVEALAGGHPRIWLLLSGCVSIHAIDDLVPLFLEALDDLTPYYQDRLRELGDQQQEIVVLLSEAGGALSNRELAERSGLPQNQVATILRQLTDRGYVRRAEVPEDLAQGDARMSYWELREPLMRLCLDVKQARGKPLRMVVEFLRAWYGSKLLDELVALPPGAELANRYASEAVRTLEELPSQDLFRGAPDEVLARAEAGLAADPARWQLQYARATSLQMLGRFDEAEEAYEMFLSSSPPEGMRLIFEVSLAVIREVRGEELDSEELVEKLMDLAELDQPDAKGTAALGLTAIGAHEKAVEVFSAVPQSAPEDPSLLSAVGKSLHELDRHEEALQVREKAIRLADSDGDWTDSQRARLFGDYGLSLLFLDRYEEALSAVERASVLDSGSGFAWGVQGLLQEKLNRPEDALSALERAAEIESTSDWAFNEQAMLLVRLRRLEEAEKAALRATELEPEVPTYRTVMGGINLVSGKTKKGVSELRRAFVLREKVDGEFLDDSESLCQVLWEFGFRDLSVVNELIDVYVAVGAAGELGRALVTSIDWFANPEVSLERANSWVAAWSEGEDVDDLQIPIRLLNAALGWKKDRNRSHLLALPPEQREILVNLLELGESEDQPVVDP
jgi:tetratricopeptide (TPR) repeat protein